MTVYGESTGLGSQFWNDGGIRVNANGYQSYYDAISNCNVALGSCRSWLKKRRQLPNSNWMSLGCGIGQFVRNVNAIQAGEEARTDWVPLDESQVQQTLFNVGLHTQFRADYSGQLICFANDAHTLYWNNGGYLEVTVTRVSWPPVNSIYYLPLELPSCDSAYAVYANYGDGSLQCNPNGGGSGWKANFVNATGTVKYGSGIPDWLVRTDQLLL